MRAAVSGLVLGVGLVVALVVGFTEAQTQRPAGQERVGSAPELIALNYDGGEGRQQVTIVDPRQRVMAVYQIDRATGALTLRSVRNLQWDLLIEEFNSEKPTPREVRLLTQQGDRR